MVLDPPIALVIEKVILPVVGISVTVPLALNCKVIVRLMVTAPGPEMGMAVPTLEKVVAGGTWFKT
jgi:hypothetical protein